MGLFASAGSTDDLGLALTKLEVSVLLDELDTRKDGLVSFDDFLTCIKDHKTGLVTNLHNSQAGPPREGSAANGARRPSLELLYADESGLRRGACLKAAVFLEGRESVSRAIDELFEAAEPSDRATGERRLTVREVANCLCYCGLELSKLQLVAFREELDLASVALGGAPGWLARAHFADAMAALQTQPLKAAATQSTQLKALGHRLAASQIRTNILTRKVGREPSTSPPSQRPSGTRPSGAPIDSARNTDKVLSSPTSPTRQASRPSGAPRPASGDPLLAAAPPKVPRSPTLRPTTEKGSSC